jgi:hypothetical protein
MFVGLMQMAFTLFFNRMAFTLLTVIVINGMHKSAHIHEHTKSEADPGVG